MSDDAATTNEKPVPTGVQLLALDPTFQKDPYPVYDDLRERDPIHKDDVLHRYVLTRHDDVAAILKDRSLSVDPRNAAAGTFEQMFAQRREERDRPNSMLFSDPPYHTRLRGLVSKAFSAKAIEEMRPRIQQVVDELLDAVERNDTFDLIASFAGPLPTIVIAEMLGVDPADRDDFKRWSDDGVLGFDPLITPEMRARMEQSGAELEAYFRRAIAERRANPRNDLITSLIQAEEDGDTLTDEEILIMCALLLAAGNVTTTDLIGNGVLALLRNPDQYRMLREDPSLVRNAVEEMLRYDPPVTQTGRIPLQDVDVAGVPIAAGQSINPQLAAANHDPARYDEPDKFDITRQDTHHQSFGGGAHFCLGAPLARLEAQIAIATLTRRFPSLRLADEPLEYRRIPSFRGLAKLTVLV
jgi:cytochrome P450